ncbi:E3 ubiquitin-protein ligase RING1 [Apostasia shenzhenica]|uniref:RING-type E3 ubiquitin transferase n=1 Tax=Apostasia shenzhenica TaxID=1088818 RepID=A0A2I0APF9_9ASPA|nr:E3 ubiquitin-protein ligase RING1 [Apostasia shenzhenica]
MSGSTVSDLFFFPFHDTDGEDDGPETLASSEPADALAGWVSDDDFVISRQISASGSNDCLAGLRIVDSDSGTDTDEQIVAFGSSPVECEIDLSFPWECLEGPTDPIDEFDWENIADRVDEGEISRLMDFAEGIVEGGADQARIVDWELLLAMNNLGETFLVEEQLGIVFPQFLPRGGGEPSTSGRPAAKSVVESLPSIFLAEEDATDNNCCAVCKDEISPTQSAKKLPCSHHYHENCIGLWLDRRNTCPLCRYELPIGEAAVVVHEEEAEGRHDLDLLPAA